MNPFSKVLVLAVEPDKGIARGAVGARAFVAYYWGGHRVVRNVYVEHAAWTLGGFVGVWTRWRIARAVKHALMMQECA